MKTEYKIVWNRTVGDLDGAVNRNIEHGWKPIGGIAIAAWESPRYYQAMTRVTGVESSWVKMAKVPRKSMKHDNWIKTSDRIPEPHTNILHCDYSGKVNTGYYEGDSFIVIGGVRMKASHVSHWMPFPEPPE